MPTVSRETRRERLVSHFTTDLTGTGNPYQAVYGHDVRDFKGQSPVLLVLSSGTARTPHGLGTTKYQAPMRFALLTFVRDADPDNGWTSANVEDAIDSCEAALADSVMLHRSDPDYWINMMFTEEFSEILPSVIAGDPYKMEVSVIIMEVYDA